MLGKFLAIIRRNPVYTLIFVNLAVGLMVIGLGMVWTQQSARLQPNISQSISNGEQLKDTPGSFAEISDCLSKPANELNSCLTKFLENYTKAKNYPSEGLTKRLLADLEQSRASSPTLENECHPIAHAIGRQSYELKGNVGDAFEACDFTCHSGCYHGVMERLFFSDEQLAQGSSHLSLQDLSTKIPTVCSRDNFRNPTNQLIFQCLHGIGHAITFSLEYKLNDSLSACDFLPSQYDRSSCYGGVFMENVVAFDQSKRTANPKDPLYPCNTLDSKYVYDCLAMQTSLMFSYGMDVSKIAQTCRTLPEGQVEVCFRSLGRDLSNNVRTGKLTQTVDDCENKSSGFTLQCTAGVVYALVDNSWNAKFAFPYCAGFQQAENRKACFENTRNYLLGAHSKTKEEVVSDCDSYAGEFAAVCKEELSADRAI